MALDAESTSCCFGYIPAALVTFLLGLFVYWLNAASKHRLPDGPWGFPVVGHLPLMGDAPHRKFSEWASIYGSVFRIRMGSRLSVVISGYDAIKEALVTQSEDFAGRPHFPSFEQIGGGRSLSFSKYGPAWKAHKTLARSALSLFTQKQVEHLESRVVEEADTIVEELMSTCGPVNPRQSIHVATAAIVFSICFDDGLSIRDNKMFLEVLRDTEEISNVLFNPADFIPWTRPFFRWRMAKVTALLEKFNTALNECQERLKSNWIPHEPRNLADALFDIAEDTGDEALQEKGLSRDHVLAILGDVMGAGIDTAVSFLRWALLYMVEFPEVQRRAQEEIESQIGCVKAPSYSDRFRLPFCEATFFEVLRFANLVPFLLPHAATHDCTFRGYDIPDGTLAFFDVNSVLRDPEMWDRPEEFDPQRFIDTSTGQLDREKTERVIAFGMGKRRCLGEFLGRLETFVFFIRLLQRCNFSKAHGEEYSLEGKLAFVLDALPYKIKIELMSDGKD